MKRLGPSSGRWVGRAPRGPGCKVTCMTAPGSSLGSDSEPGRPGGSEIEDWRRQPQSWTIGLFTVGPLWAATSAGSHWMPFFLFRSLSIQGPLIFPSVSVLILHKGRG